MLFYSIRVRPIRSGARVIPPYVGHKDHVVSVVDGKVIKPLKAGRFRLGFMPYRFRQDFS